MKLTLVKKSCVGQCPIPLATPLAGPELCPQHGTSHLCGEHHGDNIAGMDLGSFLQGQHLWKFLKVILEVKSGTQVS